MKKEVDSKKKLFENMVKLNPDFKPKEVINEEKKSEVVAKDKKEVIAEDKKKVLTEDKKWIQKAINPEHAGFCTPETKSTCTPRRKALAKRFKKGIEDEAYGTPAPLGKSMAKPIKEEIGLEEGSGLGSPINNEGVNLNMLYRPQDYKKKAEELKAEIDKMFMDKERWEDIDTLYRLIIKRTKPFKQASPQELQEIFDAIGKNENVEENQEVLNERLTTFVGDIHSEISKIPGLKRLNLWSTANGFVGLYRYEKDGNAYEIEIRPVQVGTQKALWGNQIKKREERNE